MLLTENYEKENESTEVVEEATGIAEEVAEKADEAAEAVEAVEAAPEAAAEAVVTAAETPEAAEPKTEAPAAEEKAPAKKKKWWLLIILIVCVLAAGAAAYFLFFTGSVESKALKKMDAGEYSEAKEILLAADPADYSRKTLVDCNIGLIKSAIEEKGTHGKEGKRVYTMNDDITLYFEVNKDGELVLGQEYDTMISTDDLKIYLDGSRYAFFERESTIEMSIYGRSIKTVDTGNGTVDLSKSSGRVTVDSFNSTGYSSYTGTTTSIGDKDSFRTTTEAQVTRTIGAVNTLIKQLGLSDITIKDLFVED